jgi:hypothetical protein
MPKQPTTRRQTPATTLEDTLYRSYEREIGTLRAALQRLADGAEQRSLSSADILAICAEAGVRPIGASEAS